MGDVEPGAGVELLQEVLGRVKPLGQHLDGEIEEGDEMWRGHHRCGMVKSLVLRLNRKGFASALSVHPGDLL